MTVKARIILIVIFLIGLFLAVNSVRKKKMQLKYALPWILCSIVLMIFAAVPGLLQGLAALMGIYSPVNLIFFLGFIFSLCIAFVQSITISKTSAQLRQLAQSVALMEKRFMEAERAGSDAPTDDK